jgi:hypothetical protein
MENSRVCRWYKKKHNTSGKINDKQLMNIKKMKKFHFIILSVFVVSAVSCQPKDSYAKDNAVSCRQNDAYVKDSIVYFRGKEIFKGNKDIVYPECIFMEEQNAIIYVKRVYEEYYNEIYGEDGWRISPKLSGIFKYDITTKESERIINSDNYLVGHLKSFDNCIYFHILYHPSERIDFTQEEFLSEIKAECTTTELYKYSFQTKKIDAITKGVLLDIIKEEEYKGYLVVFVNK